MKTFVYLVLAVAAVTMLLLSAGCEKPETAQQEALKEQQKAVSGAGTSEPEAAAAQNLSDGLDEALAELDTVG